MGDNGRLQPGWDLGGWPPSLPPSLPSVLACKNDTAQLKTQTQARMVELRHRHTGRAAIKTETHAAALIQREERQSSSETRQDKRHGDAASTTGGLSGPVGEGKTDT